MLTFLSSLITPKTVASVPFKQISYKIPTPPLTEKEGRDCMGCPNGKLATVAAWERDKDAALEIGESLYRLLCVLVS